MKDDEKLLRELVASVRSKLRITKVVATRSVKGRGGDTFAGFSAAWESVQDDAGGPGSDLVETVSAQEIASQGMNPKEARMAHYLLAMQADTAAYEAAMASGNMSVDEGNDRIRALRNNYGKLIRSLMGDDERQ